MKKILLSLAAAAALASCVEEKGLDPQQPLENQVVIKALTADTKTVISGDDHTQGLSVLWENDDAITVIFKGSDVDTYTANFTTNLTENSKKADFIGNITDMGDGYDDKGYAVYPSDILNDEIVVHTIPAVQNGTPATGDNLSYATLSLTSLKKGSVDAYFNNALSLLRVVVPEGTDKVTISSDKTLAGKVPFKFEDDHLVLDEYNLTSGFGQAYCEEKKSIELSSESELEAGKAYYILVVPGTHTLTVKMEGADVVLENTLKEVALEASGCYGLDLTEIFSLYSKDFYASPFGGGTIEIPVITTLETEEYTVDFNFGTHAPWLSVAAPVKSAMRQDVVSLTVAEGGNTAEERSALVRITGNTSGKKVIAKVIQKAFNAELLGDYVEMYSTGYGQPTVTGKFTIEKSDDLTKGLYKIVNILGNNTVYADFAVGTLSIYDGTRTRALTVSADYKMTGSLTVGTTSASEYAAVASQGEAQLTVEEEALVGVYDEAWSHDVSSVASPKGMTINVSDEAAFGQLKVSFLKVNESVLECYADLSGSVLTIYTEGASHPVYGKIWMDTELTVGDSKLSFENSFYLMDGSYKEISGYVATKAEESAEPENPGEGGTITASDLVGTWNESFSAGGSPYTSTEMTITLTDDSSKGQLKVKMFNYVSYNTKYFLECYADLSSDGMTLTVKTNGVDYSGMGTFSEDMIMTVSEGGSKITYAKTINTSYMMPIGNLVATKQ